MQNDIGKTESDITTMSYTIVNHEGSIKQLEERMEELRNEWRVLNENLFEFEQENCPTCGQSLPTDKLETAREKALAEFNQNKSEALETINADGKRLKEQRGAPYNNQCFSGGN